MKKILLNFAILFVFFLFGTVCLAGEHSHGHEAIIEKQSEHAMDHGDQTDSFKHQIVTEGIRAEFEVMSLEKMNVKDTKAGTHHVMVKFFHDKMNHQIKEAAGKIKVIAPDKKEQILELANYDGIFAANFKIDQKGKYGIICAVKIDDKNYVFKLWYPN
jgi:hypothetical protein